MLFLNHQIVCLVISKVVISKHSFNGLKFIQIYIFIKKIQQILYFKFIYINKRYYSRLVRRPSDILSRILRGFTWDWKLKVPFKHLCKSCVRLLTASMDINLPPILDHFNTRIGVECGDVIERKSLSPFHSFSWPVSQPTTRVFRTGCQARHSAWLEAAYTGCTLLSNSPCQINIQSIIL